VTGATSTTQDQLALLRPVAYPFARASFNKPFIFKQAQYHPQN
jgi:hypothetical protein